MCPFPLCLRCLSILHYFLSLQMEFWQHKTSITTWSTLWLMLSELLYVVTMMYLSIGHVRYKKRRNIFKWCIVLLHHWLHHILFIPFITVVLESCKFCWIKWGRKKYHVSSNRPLWLFPWSVAMFSEIYVPSKYSRPRSIEVNFCQH